MIGTLLKQFATDTGISQKEIATRLGFSNQRVNNYFRDIADPPKDFFDKFRAEFNIDLKQLLDKEKKILANGVASYNPIPVFDLDLKPTKDLNFFDHSELVAYYIDAPLFNDCFAAVRVTGSAMSPEFNASDLITIKRIMNFEAIPFGEPFFIVTEEQRLLRYIRRNDKDPVKTFILRAEGKDNDDIIIKKSDITFLFQVKGKITRR